ncbi:hypothetical protein L1887_23255 [Cichorium endivia]|nr:hypothetical protein L1887_23255 [Cichorium endivia]
MLVPRLHRSGPRVIRHLIFELFCHKIVKEIIHDHESCAGINDASAVAVNSNLKFCQTLKPNEYIGMVRREVLDAYLRDRVAAAGATIINGLFFKMEKPTNKYAP